MVLPRDLARLAILGLVLMAIGADHQGVDAADSLDGAIPQNQQVDAADSPAQQTAKAAAEKLAADQANFKKDTAATATNNADVDAEKLKAAARENAAGDAAASSAAADKNTREEENRNEQAAQDRQTKLRKATVETDRAAEKLTAARENAANNTLTANAPGEEDSEEEKKTKEIATKQLLHAQAMADYRTKVKNQQREKLKAEQIKEDATKTAEKQEATKAAANAVEAKRLKAACVRTCPTQCTPAASRTLLGELLELGDDEAELSDASGSQAPSDAAPIVPVGDAASILRRAHHEAAIYRKDEDEYKQKAHELHNKILHHDNQAKKKVLDTQLQVATERFKQHKKQSDAKIAQQAAKIKATVDQATHELTKEKESKKVLTTKLCEVKCEKRCEEKQ